VEAGGSEAPREPGGPSLEIVHPLIEHYVTGLVPPRDAVLAAVEGAAYADHVPVVGPLEGQVLYLIARLARARRVLEVGSATGYSAIWLARAARAQGGSLVGIELDARRQAEAERNLARAGLADAAQIIRGDAFEVLPTLTDQFDLIFVDLVRQLGDAERLRRLYELTFARLVVGGVLVIDNVLHGGEVVEPRSPGGRAADALNRLISTDRRLISVILTVRDGLTVALKVAE